MWYSVLLIICNLSPCYQSYDTCMFSVPNTLVLFMFNKTENVGSVHETNIESYWTLALSQCTYILTNIESFWTLAQCTYLLTNIESYWNLAQCTYLLTNIESYWTLAQCTYLLTNTESYWTLAQCTYLLTNILTDILGLFIYLVTIYQLATPIR